MRKKAFTLTEMLICLMILMVLMSGISVLIKSDSTENIAKQDMDRLARWLNNALARADRWKRGFYISINLSKGDRGSYMNLFWDGIEDLSQETFFADSRIYWTYNAETQDVLYNWATHTVTPAFTINALNINRTSTGESLTMSLRALVTRESS